MGAPPDTAGAIEIPGPWQHRYVAANGARFHVVEAQPVSSPEPGGRSGGAELSAAPGDPPLVLLLHGFPEFWWTWRDQIRTLAAHGYRVAAMDLRGYGGSDKPPRGYDPLTLSRDVVGVVKALGERSAVLVGHGWGGYVAWAAAALHPREVSALCAVSAPHPNVMLSSLRSRNAVALRHLLAMQVPTLPERRLSRASTGFLRSHLESWSSPSSTFPDEETVATYQAALRLWPAPHCALEYHRWLFRSRFRGDGRRFHRYMQRPVAQPVCVVNGADDPALPRGGADRSQRQVTGPYETHALPGVGHFPHEEAPDAFDDVLLRWLAAIGRD